MGQSYLGGGSTHWLSIRLIRPKHTRSLSQNRLIHIFAFFDSSVWKKICNFKLLDTLNVDRNKLISQWGCYRKKSYLLLLLTAVVKTYRCKKNIPRISAINLSKGKVGALKYLINFFYKHSLLLSWYVLYFYSNQWNFFLHQYYNMISD